MNPPFRFSSLGEDPARDVREEIESHIAMETEDLIAAGLGPDEARAVAEKRLGDRRKIEAQATRYAARFARRQTVLQTLEALRWDIANAARILRKGPLFTALTVLLLALGIGANTAVFSMLEGVFLEPLDLPAARELVFLWEEHAGSQPLPSSYANYRDWKEGSRSIRDMGAYLARQVNLTGDGESVRVRSALTTASLFSVLGVDPELGRPLLPEEDASGERVAVLGHGIWQTRYGGDPEIIGRDVGLDGEPYRVVGVMPDGFEQPDPTGVEPIQVWLPLPAGTELEPRQSGSFQVLGRLSSGIGLQTARGEMARIATGLAEAYPETNRGVGVRVEPVHEVLFGEAGRQIALVLGAAILVLLVACGNVASLQLARTSIRRGEMAVRRALGGSRGRMVRQLLTENTLLAFMGGVVAVFVAWWSLSLLTALAPPELPRARGVRLDGFALLLSLAASLAVGLFVGLAPGVRAVRLPVSAVLKEEEKMDRARSRAWTVQSGYILAQVALSLVLGNAALLLARSYGALGGNELGFRTENVLTMEMSLRGKGYSISRGRGEFYDELLPRLQALPGVVEVGAGTSLPMGMGGHDLVVKEEDWGRPVESVGQSVETDRVAGAFFSSLGIPLVSGRHFVRGQDDPRFRDARAILNEAAASLLWPGEDPLGRRFSRAGRDPEWITVIGVVADTRNGGLGTDPLPEIYLPYASFPTGTMYLTLRTATDPVTLAPAVIREIRQVDPIQAVSRVRTMNEVVGGHLSRRKFYTTLVGAFAMLALVLAGVGIFGTVSQYVASRGQEMGIRMALGSGTSGLRALILRRTLGLAGVGIALGLSLVFLTQDLIRAYLYGVEPIDGVTLGTVATALFLVAILAAAIPAVRASRVDPVETLRRC